jgi:RHS repeat-associated protein
MGYRYNLAGQLTKLIYPDGYEINYWYMPGTEFIYGVYDHFNVYHARMTNYTPDAMPGMIEYGGYAGNYSAVDEYTYNPLSTRLERIVSRPLTGTGVLQDLQYRYSPAGDIIEIKDNVRLVTYAYSYDKLHRLVQELATGYAPIIQNATLDYTYDDGFQPHAVKTIALDGAGYDYTYDDNGNMDTGPDFSDTASVASRTITYNADNMPLSITHSSGGTTQFLYDGQSKRITKITPAGTTYYVNEFFEINNGTVVKYIFAGVSRIAKRVDNDTYYYHKDHLGSTRSITNSVGEEQEHTAYMPFGHQRSHFGTSITNYKYTDQELDSSTGFYNYDARLYDPVIGRFISADSVIQNWYNPQALNRYAYVLNNPLIYIDPSGHDAQSTWLNWLKTTPHKRVG